MIRLKNETQINGIRESCKLLARLFEELLPKVKEGMSTKAIDDICVAFIKKHGGKPAWYRENFPGAACISVNDEVIHGIPSKKRILEEGDIVSIDIGIDYKGYISDASRTVGVGKVSKEAQQLMDITEQCFNAGAAACIAGNRIHDIGKAVSDIADKAGYGVVYEYCGHGVGLDVHEDPSIPNIPKGGANPRIQAGMVLAVEPMINLGTADTETAEDGWTVLTADGKLSSHHENTLAVFADHTEILTVLP
ncbi:type I methionyl aminopeptidase [Treponema sp. OMZ 840]|uniref:type I methionyl aminopeptidase n=1 Tax=Treponema sp. OMZ 840 TaxID=244313 RepID=UPI003D8FEA40